MQIPINESDWKLFRTKLPRWQEAHMERLNQEYAALLASSDSASEKFWALEKRINTDKQSVGVIARMSRSNMYHNISSLLSEHVITLDDLADFSEEMRNRMAFAARES